MRQNARIWTTITLLQSTTTVGKYEQIKPSAIITTSKIETKNINNFGFLKKKKKFRIVNSEIIITE